jgi:hypothetical protein
VAWQLANDYVGWSPLLTPGPADDQIRGGAWTFAPMGVLGSTNLASRVLHEPDLRGRVQEVQRVQNLAERGGVVFNRGPAFDLVEKSAGALPRVKIEPLEPQGSTGAATAARPGDAKGGTKGGTKVSERAAPPPVAIEPMRKAAEDAARVARSLADRGGPLPASLRMVRAAPSPPAAETGAAPPKAPPRAPAARKGGAADTTAH